MLNKVKLENNHHYLAISDNEMKKWEVEDNYFAKATQLGALQMGFNGTEHALRTQS